MGMGILSKGVILAAGYFFIGGAIVWSDQMKILALIVAGIWVLMP